MKGCLSALLGAFIIFIMWLFVAVILFQIIGISPGYADLISFVLTIIIGIVFCTYAKKEKKKEEYPKFSTIQSNEQEQQTTPPSSYVLDVDPDTLPPPKKRYDGGYSDAIENHFITIRYCNQKGDETRRTIRLKTLDYTQFDTTITPTHIYAFCMLRGEYRTFLVRSIQKAYYGQEYGKDVIENLNAFLIVHTSIPRQYEHAHEASSSDIPLPSQRARLKKVLLDDPRVTLFCGFKNPERKPVSYTMRLDSMQTATKTEEIDSQWVEVTSIRSVTGFCLDTRSRKTITFSRIVAACDPDTGEVIDNIVSYLKNNTF